MRALVLVACVALAACSSSEAATTAPPVDAGVDADLGPITGPVTGTVEDVTLSAVSGFGTYIDRVASDTGHDDGKSIPGLSLILSNQTSTCDAPNLADATFLVLQILGDPIAPGTYQGVDLYAKGSLASPAAGEVTAEFTNLTSCHQGVYTTNKSGTVTITQVTPSIQGSLDLVFKTGEHIRGTFDAANCGKGSMATCN